MRAKFSKCVIEIDHGIIIDFVKKLSMIAGFFQNGF